MGKEKGDRTCGRLRQVLEGSIHAKMLIMIYTMIHLITYYFFH